MKNFVDWIKLYVTAVYFYIQLLADTEKVLEKRYDVCAKSWNFCQ